MNSEKIFEIALGLVSPWYVKSLKLETSTKQKELHIYLDYESSFYKPKQERVTYTTI